MIRQAEFAQKFHVVGNVVAYRGEHVAGYRGGRGTSQGTSSVVAQKFSSCGKSNVRCRVDVSEGGKRAHDVFGLKRRQIFQRRALNRREHVNRD